MSKIIHSKDINELLDFSILVSSIGLMLIFFPISHKGIIFFPTSFKFIFWGFPFIQGLSFFLLLFMLCKFGFIDFIKLKFHSFFNKETKKEKRNMSLFKKKHVILLFCLFFVISSLIACEILYGNNFGEWAFARTNIKTSTKLPNIIESWKDKVAGNLKNNSTPSGFVLRQWLILLFSLNILKRNKIHDGSKGKYFSNRVSITFKLIFMFSFVYVLLSRLFLEQHTLVDIVVAISLGTIIYFLVVFIIAIIVKKNIEKTLLNRFSIFCIYSLLIFLIISKNPITFFYMGPIIIFAIIPLLYIFSRDDWGTDSWI